ncbi:MAG: hypothetical protein ACJ71T_08640 [Actinomycetales bacterium]
MRKSLSAVLLVLFALLVSAMTSASAAAAPGPTLHFSVSSRVAVLARGAALAVPVTYVCPVKYSGSTGYAIFTAEVQQRRADGTLVDGFDAGGGNAILTCDGAVHEHEVIVQPQTQGAYEAPASATVTTGVLACNAAETNCRQPTKTYQAQLRAAAPGDPANQPVDGAATVRPDGGVLLALNVGCAPGSFVVADATFTQRVHGDDAAFGETRSEPGCNRTTTTLTIEMDSFRARTGVAYVIGDRQTCSQSSCTHSTTFRGTVQIT